MAKTYKFKCKNCGHEYLHDNDPVWECPECEIENQNCGII